jgi:hypothetical protein
MVIESGVSLAQLAAISRLKMQEPGSLRFGNRWFRGSEEKMSPPVRRIVALLIACAVAFGVIYFIDHLAANSVTLTAGGHVSSGA